MVGINKKELTSDKIAFEDYQNFRNRKILTFENNDHTINEK